MSKFPRIRTTLSKGVILPSLIFIIGVSLLAAIFPQITNELLNVIKTFIFVNLNWIYVWSVTIFIIFLIYLMASKYGNIRLGRNNSKPDYSFFSWISMLFAAGMGIGLMYFSVAEPIQHYSNEVFSNNTALQRAQDAQMYTFFHWGIHAWAIYAIVGLALSYFAYRYRLPLSLRSCFYPLLKDKIKGKWGNMIDVFALCSTFFGITTTLGFGVVQINSGLQTLNILPENSFIYQVLIVAVLVSLSIISAVSGLDKGVKLLSSINIIAVVVLLVFVLALGPTVYLIGSFTEGIGNYISNFFTMTFSTHSFNDKTQPWFYDWTILYWAWWISWSPYVGLFIAKISKGRTIREYIAAVLLLPTLFNFIWMSVFGNSAIWFDMNVADGALSTIANNPDALMFEFLAYLPLSSITSFLTISIIIIFFVTSADSGMFVMNSISTKNAIISPKWQTIGWGVLLAVLALLLLNAGGLGALQSMTLITALPFSIIMLLFIVSLIKALVIDKKYYETDFSTTTVTWSGDSWKERLKQIVSFDDKESVHKFIDTTVKEAFKELETEFAKNNIDAVINTYEGPYRLEIEIKHDLVNNFIYGVKTESKMVSDYLLSEENLPDINDNKTFYPKAYFGDYRQGYDVHIFTKNELISDVLKHYERFLEIISEEKNEMFISSDSNHRLR
ncbi:BCCT family transporter [Myroides odoratimimus]|uniref:Choline/glycine/proline betaine transport protein n=1 Tax=Myroides marinus TaxID=703342 RepID=A0A1H6YLH9_9FLAO|nr:MULTISPECIES: BCCT family transporter [Myroides]MDM1401278.1 BCCT family transporter [Myroides odoratimimus]MEC4035757.1 BCCT family transporter [Myroides odoratimimus]MEC4084949.1 BCCT family transporter [Myroides odoratimimus]UVD78823.1 BCCT family transporter [Myroides albus]SEJ37585.1 choline/glycine/proline betaine transport protein [Myroides marinus]